MSRGHGAEGFECGMWNGECGMWNWEFGMGNEKRRSWEDRKLRSSKLRAKEVVGRKDRRLEGEKKGAQGSKR
jgi:hypothetical protein